jgi:hypothetical protein
VPVALYNWRTIHVSTRIRGTIFVAVMTAALAGGAPAMAEPTWAPAGSATVKPGSETLTDGAQCTSNFVFFDAANNVYIGQAAHCSGTEGNTATNGCIAGTLPTGTPVEIEGASRPGTIVYSSWVTMQARGETDSNTCRFNDFALIQLDPADYGKVNPSIPFWGGPTGTATTTSQGDDVYSYGNSSLRFGAGPLKPKRGKSLGASGGGWTHQVYTATPGIPGDSGSAFIDEVGMAFGVLSTLQIAPLAGANGVSDLSRAQAYMEATGGPDVTLANGTEPFNGSRIL